MGRPLKIKTPEEMEQLWEKYKADCDNQEVLTHDFSSKNSKFVSAKLKRSITYTIEGGYLWGFPDSSFMIIM